MVATETTTLQELSLAQTAALLAAPVRNHTRQWLTMWTARCYNACDGSTSRMAFLLGSVIVITDADITTYTESL